MAKYETIYEQLGGRRFVAMTGASRFYGFDGTLRFRLPSRFAKGGINFVSITLTPADTYTIEYGKAWGMKYKKIAEQEDIYADSLRAAFKRATGLDCTL